MKKREHRDNSHDIKDKATNLNIENSDSNLESEKIPAEDDSSLAEEVLIAPDELSLTQAKVAELTVSLKDMNDKYLRLSAEFDNYRKRTLKERIELTKTASESVLLGILPVIDDFERAMHSIEQGLDFEATKEGILLIYNKFNDFSKQNGITEINAQGQVFDTDLHEALTKIPAPSEDMKGKIVQVIQKGYYLNEKVIRFARVVVGE